MPEHAIEGLVAILVMLGGVVAGWINLASRVQVIEKVFQAHLEEKSEIMHDLNTKMARIETKVDRVALRCAAFSALHKMAEPRVPFDNGENGEAADD